MAETVTRLEAMEILGCKTTKFYDMIKEGKIPRGGGVGKKRFWKRSVIEAIRDASMPSKKYEKMCIDNASAIV